MKKENNNEAANTVEEIVVVSDKKLLRKKFIKGIAAGLVVGVSIMLCKDGAMEYISELLKDTAEETSTTGA